eukprot:12888071-Prorocentrum_lima.AAC.1
MARGPTVMAGDWNARLQARLTEEDQYLGKHFFDRHNTTLDRQVEGTQQNREKLLHLCIDFNLRVCNTTFKKDDIKLITYREPGVGFEPPYTRG